jgi:hypothetical protein
VRIGNQTTNKIDHKVSETTMVDMFNLRNVLEMVSRGFQDAVLAEQEIVGQ